MDDPAAIQGRSSSHQMRHFYLFRTNHKSRIISFPGSLILAVLLTTPALLFAQATHDSLPSRLTLNQCIDFALSNQAQVKQAMIDEEITKKDVRTALSGWYPQIELDANIQHYFVAPMTSIPNQLDPSGPPIRYPATSNQTSSGLFLVNQTLFNSNLYLAASSSKERRKQASQNTELTKIDTYVGVAKAFYDVLLTEQQLRVLDEDIVRLQRNYDDAYNLYKNGITDNIDYQRARIALSNVQAQRRASGESVKTKYAVLKQLMGVPPEKKFSVSYDSSRFENETVTDTAKVPDYKTRVEYQQMQTALNLQGADIRYSRSNFFPSLSAFYEFIPSYGSDQFASLYSKTSSSSFVGLKLTYPIFQGLSRFQGLGKARLQYKRLQVGTEYLENVISSEYTSARSQYVSNLDQLKVSKENMVIARNIFNTVKYQYDKGIKAYLEVIVSETDLRTAELNYLDMMFRVLSSKLDLEKALGLIQPK